MPTTLNIIISNIRVSVDNPHDIIIDTMRGEKVLKMPNVNFPIKMQGTHNIIDIINVFSGLIVSNFLIIKIFSIEVISDKEPSPTTSE